MEPMEIILGILILSLTVVIVGHMIYELFIKKKLSEKHTADLFRQQRMEAGKSPESTAEEDEEAEILLNDAFVIWPVVESTADDDLRAPLKRKQVKESTLLLKRVEDLQPTNDLIIDRLNELSGCVNSANKRQFNGSKTLIIITIIIFTLISFISGGVFSWSNLSSYMFPICGLTIYIMASMTPTFVLNRRIVNGKGNSRNFMTVFIAGLFGMIAAAPTYKTVTKWSDGSTTSDTDHGATWFSLILTFFVLVLVGFFIAVIGLINYIRNYLLYV